MNNKSEALIAFQLFKAQVKFQFHKKIKILQTDGEGSLSCLFHFLTPVESYYDSCQHIHGQNRVVELKHRHILETGLTLLA